MAQLKIYSDIQSEDTKDMVSFWGGVEGVSFVDVDEFISSIPEDDDEIDLRLHCNGGEVLEGFAIYDKLRSTGKTISATVEGTCASMATVILLAAPKNRRSAYKNASLLIHEPYMAFTTSHGTAEELQKAADSLKRIEDKIIDIYAERCGTSKKGFREVMKKGEYLGVEEAKELGLVSTIIEPISAKKVTNNIINKAENMEQNETITVEKSWLQKALAFLGIGDKSPVSLVFETEGGDLTVERESGKPQPGDSAKPDGTFVLSDGTTVVVEGGVIISVEDKKRNMGGGGVDDDTSSDDSGDDSGNSGDGGDDNTGGDDTNGDDTTGDGGDDDDTNGGDDTGGNDDTTTTTEGDTTTTTEGDGGGGDGDGDGDGDTTEPTDKDDSTILMAQVEELKAKAKTGDEEAILAYVESVGGIDVLKKMVSTYTPIERDTLKQSPVNKEDEETYRDRIDDLRERIKARNKLNK